RVDEVELVLLDRAVPTGADRDWLRHVVDSLAPVRLATLMRTARGAAELPRWRYGFTAAEATELGTVAGVVRLLVCSSDRPSLPTGIGPVDLVHALRAGEVLADVVEEFVEARRAGHRFLVDGLVELDRTLDVRPGLLDRIGNPTPYHHALAVLNSALHGPVRISRDGDRYRVVRADGRRLVVDLCREPDGGAARPAGAADEVVDLSDAMTCRPSECAGPWLELSA